MCKAAVATGKSTTMRGTDNYTIVIGLSGSSPETVR